jgi:hypothetical protein
MVIVFNATCNNISVISWRSYIVAELYRGRVISWRSVLSVEESVVPEKTITLILPLFTCFRDMRYSITML